ILQSGDYAVQIHRVLGAGRYSLTIDIANAAWASAYGSLLQVGNQSAIGLDNSYIARPTSDGGLLFAGSTEGLNSGAPLDAWLTKLDAFGTPAWSKTYGANIGGTNLLLIGQTAAETPDGYAFVAESESGALVIKVDK